MQTRRFSWGRFARLGCLALVGCGMAAATAGAQTYTWGSVSSGDWNTAANWGGTFPGEAGNGAVANFSAAAGLQTAVNLSASETIAGLVFAASAPAYTLATGAGQTLTIDINNSTTALNAILDTSTATETIDGAVTILNSASSTLSPGLGIATGGSLVFGASSTLTLNIGITMKSNAAYAGDLHIDGAYVAAAGVTLLWNPVGGTLYYDPTSQTLGTGAALRSASAAIVELQKAFTGSGGLLLTGNGSNVVGGATAAGVIYLDADGLNETDAVTMGGRAGAAGTPFVSTFTYGANAAGTAAVTQSGAVTFNSVLNNIATANFDTASGNTMTISGKVSGTPGAGSSITVQKTGAGTLILSNAANSFTAAATNVNAGKLLVTGSTSTGGAVNVNAGGALGGAGGTLTATGVTVASGGGLSISGGGAIPAGTLTLALGSGSLDLSGAMAHAGELAFVLGSGGASDRVNLSSASSTLNIGGGLLSLADFSFTTGGAFGLGTYILFDTSSAAGIVGTLASGGLSETLGGYDVTLALSTDAGHNQDIVLSVAAAPEPGVAALLLAAAAGAVPLAARRRSAATA